MRSKLASIVKLADVAERGSNKGSGKPPPRFVCFIAPTINGWKLPILFEEVRTEYEVVAIVFDQNEQKSAEFLRINPNGRIPALYDRETGVTLAESGAILQYLCEQVPAAALLPGDVAARYGVLFWVFWQVSGLGPMMAQGECVWRCAVHEPHERACG
jgi:GST-like protein